MSRAGAGMGREVDEDSSYLQDDSCPNADC